MIFGGEGSVLVGANTTALTIENLEPNSSYCYRIMAYNDNGNSSWSEWACATTLSPPNTPTNTSTRTATPTRRSTSTALTPTPTNTPPLTGTPASTRMPLTHLFVKSTDTGGIKPVEIRGLDDELLLSCVVKRNEDNGLKDCGDFEAIGSYKFIANTALCGVQQGIFEDALPEKEVIREVICNVTDDD